MTTSPSIGKPPKDKSLLWLVDLGRQAYAKTRELQIRLVSARLEERIPDVLLLLEHDPVFTLGRHGRWENLLLSKEALQERGIPCIPVERGGDITYHGPGQLVGYPVVRVAGQGREVKALVKGFEEVLIRTLATFDIQGRAGPANPGVWVGKSKVGSIGIAVRHGISFHGFSLNVNPDLTPFSWIHPCGHKDLTVTSIKELIGKPVRMHRVKTIVASLFAHRMGYQSARVDPSALRHTNAIGLPPQATVNAFKENALDWIDTEENPHG